MQSYSNCRYCNTNFEFFGNNIPIYCSDECYHEAWQLLSALYEFHNHDTKKTWAEFKEAVWGTLI